MRETLGPEWVLRPGSLVGSWRVVGYAGRGTYGAVSRARRDGAPDAPLVALKVAVFPNVRVGPELSALIERMLAGEPEMRSTAGEVEEAARMAAGKLGPEGDMPLFELEHREFSVAGPKHSKVERLSARRVLVAGFLMLAGVSTWWVGSGPGLGTREVENAEAPDAGTRGLGDSTRQQADSQGAPAAADVRAVARELPSQPFPGQQQPPCRLAGQRVINGGCWRRLADISSPCTEDSYEWKGSCYWPVMERARPKSSKDP